MQDLFPAFRGNVGGQGVFCISFFLPTVSQVTLIQNNLYPIEVCVGAACPWP